MAVASPSVEILSDEEFDGCKLGPEQCDRQLLEGGVPLRYRHLPAISSDGAVIAVVEERDGWAHVVPGIRFLDRTGTSVQWYSLVGTGEVARANVARSNAALAVRTWVPLEAPTPAHRAIDDDHSETTVAFGGLTATYQRRTGGNWVLPPSQIRVVRADGRVVAQRTDTETAWSAEPACNLPAFEFVAASASPGVMLFRTGLGMGGHGCDGVAQPPAWHVLAF